MEQLIEPTRFELLGVLGTGAQGVVHRARDRRRGVDVALKAIRSTDSLSILELKHEFRIASALSHPHLVRLYELFAREGSCYFTMELIEGSSLQDSVRSSDFADQLLRAGELAEAVHSLHRAHRIHRDIKPANLLVSPVRGLILLDFGFASTVRGHGDGFGTPAFAAPEILRGAPHTEASDWFSVGATLWETLSGVPIPRGPRGEPPLRTAPPRRVDPVLWEWVQKLLATKPADRPNGSAILALLGRSIRPAELIPSPSDEFTRESLIGRTLEIARLLRLYEASGAGSRTVQLLGPSGIGKTSLALGFLDALPSGTGIFRGRCGPREDVPFNALDEVMDATARALLTMRSTLRDHIEPQAAAALSRVFPVFRDGRDDVEEASLPADGQKIRGLAARGFLSLIASMSERTPIVWLDDLHWADQDSLNLLLQILDEAQGLGVLFMLSSRTELPELRQIASLEDIVLSPLSASESLELAQAWSGEDSTRVEEAACECQGSPLFLRQLVDRLATGATSEAIGSLETAIRSTLVGLPAAARDLLDLLAVASRPLSVGNAFADQSAPRVDPESLFLLHDLRLLRGNAGAEQRAIEIDHDRIREVVLGDLAPDRKQSLHLRVAQTLDAQGARPEEIVIHYVEGGRPQDGARLAFVAAESAASALAFNRAADLYALVLSLPDTNSDRRSLLAKLARSLSKAGRGEEASAAYLEGATLCAGPDALELRRQASEQLLRVGRIDEGMVVLSGVLRDLRLPNPGTWLGTLGWLAWVRLAQVAVRERPTGAVSDPRTLQRIDACFSAGLGLNMIDIRRSMLFQSVQLMLARSSGDARRLSRALAVESTYRATGSSKEGHGQAASLIARARAIASELQDQEALAFVELCDGVKMTMSGEFAEAVRQLEAAAERYRAHQDGVTWEVANCDLYKCWSSVYLGRIGMLRQLVPRLQRAAAERGDALAQVTLASGICVVAGLARGEADETRARAREARSRLPSGGFESLDYFDLVSRVAVDLYEGKGPSAYEAIREAWPRLRRGFFLNLRFFRVELRYLRARASIASALQSRDTVRRQRLDDAKAQARALARERFAFARSLSVAISADLRAVNDPNIWRAGLRALLDEPSASCPLLGKLARTALDEATGLAEEVEEPRAFLRLWMPASAALLGDTL